MEHWFTLVEVGSTLINFAAALTSLIAVLFNRHHRCASDGNRPS